MRSLAALALVLAACTAPTPTAAPTSGPPISRAKPAKIHTGPRWPGPANKPLPTTTTTQTTAAPQVKSSTVTVQTTIVTVPRSGPCGGWDGLIAALWPDWAVGGACSVLMCESNGDPRAQNPSGASGLFQVMPLWADDFQRVTGQPYYDGRFDAGANARFAAWLWGQTQSWSHWSCKP